MKAVVLTGLKRLELCDVQQPVIQSDTDVLLKIEKVGVCGSDIHYYEAGRIGSCAVEYPFILGHECSATVAQIGSAVSRVQTGAQVAVDPAVVCHECDQCRKGRPNTCRNLTFLGCPGELQGCLSEYIVMPEACLYPLKGKLTLDAAVLCEPLSIGIYAVKQSGMPSGADVAVLGAGPIGLCVLMAAKSQGAQRVFMTDKIDRRLAAAGNAGAAWTGNPDEQDVVGSILDQQPAGMDVVHECAGQLETLDQAVDLLKPGGKLMLVGIPRVERVSFVIDALRRKEITVINVRRQNNCVQSAIDIIGARAADFSFMITHHFTPDQAQQAFDTVSEYRDGVIKALIEFA